MKKRIITILLVLLLICPLVHAAEETDEITYGIMEKIDILSLQRYMQESDFYELYGYTDPVTFIYDVITDGSDAVKDISLKDAIWGIVAGGLGSAVEMIADIFFIGVMGVFVKNLSVSFLSKDVENAVNMLISLTIALSSGSLFFIASKEAVNITADVAGLLGVVCPAMLILLGMTGSVSTASLISPTLTLALGYGELIINNMIIPLSVIMFVLNIADCVTEGVNLKSLVSVIRKGSTVFLGTAFTVISGIISIEGITFSGADSIGLKAVKYAAGSLIPVVGSFLSGSMDTVLSLISVIKGGVGMLGVMIIVAILSGPVIRLFAVYGMMKITSAIISIFSSDTSADIIDRTASSLGFLLSVNVAVGVMSVMIICILMNMPATLR